MLLSLTPGITVIFSEPFSDINCYFIKLISCLFLTTGVSPPVCVTALSYVASKPLVTLSLLLRCVMADSPFFTARRVYFLCTTRYLMSASSRCSELIGVPTSTSECSLSEASMV